MSPPSESRSPTPGPPPLLPTGLVLHRDGHFTHEGQPIRHARLRARLERSVRYLADEGAYVVQIGRFRGRIEVDDAPFFVRFFEATSGEIELRNGTREPLRVDSLEEDESGVLYCELSGGHVARFTHAAQSELLAAVEPEDGEPVLHAGGVRTKLRPRPRRADVRRFDR